MKRHSIPLTNSIGPRAVVLVLFYLVLLLSSQAFVCFAEDVPANPPDGTTKKPDDDDDPDAGLTFKPDGTLEKSKSGAKIANFYDFVPNAPVPSIVNRPVDSTPPRNNASPVANQVIQNTTNESLFREGYGPNPGTFRATAAGDDGVPVIRLGPLLFQPHLDMNSIFTDNFSDTVKDRRKSFLVIYHPGVDVNYQPNKQVDVQSFFNFTDHQYTTNVATDFRDENAGLAINVHPYGLSELTFKISDIYNNYGNTVQNTLANPLDVRNLQIITGTAYFTNTLPVALNYKSDLLAVDASYTFDAINYLVDKKSNTLSNRFDLHGAYAIISNHLNVFVEYKYDNTTYPHLNANNFIFQQIGSGVSGTLEHLTYRAQLSNFTDESLSTGKVRDEIGYRFDLSYVRSRRLDFAIFANRHLDTGVLTGASLVQALGGVVNIRPLLTGQLSLSGGEQMTTRLIGTDDDKIVAVTYNHTFLKRIVPRVGIAYSKTNSTTTVGSFPPPKIPSVPIVGTGTTLSDTWTGSAGLGIMASRHSQANLEFYHEVVSTGQVTDRLTVGYDYKINHYSGANLGYDYLQRADPGIQGKIKSNELRFGIHFSW